VSAPPPASTAGSLPATTRTPHSSGCCADNC
jgi:hypothetical protein